DRRRLPDRGAAVRPRRCLFRVRIIRRRPRVTAELARRRNVVKAPYLLAGCGIERVNTATNPVVTTGHPGEDHAVEVARRAGDAVPVVVILELVAPDRVAGLLVEGDETAVEQTGEDHPVADGHPAIVPTATHQVVHLWNIRGVFPELLAGRGVK